MASAAADGSNVHSARTLIAHTAPRSPIITPSASVEAGPENSYDGRNSIAAARRIDQLAMQAARESLGARRITESLRVSSTLVDSGALRVNTG